MHQLTTAMPILLQMDILTDLENRLKLKALLMEDLCKNVAFPKGINFNRSFVATGANLIQFNVETPRRYFFCGSFMFLFCLVFAMSLCTSVYMCFVVTCWERADLLALVLCGYCEFVTFPLVSWVRCGT